MPHCVRIFHHGLDAVSLEDDDSEDVADGVTDGVQNILRERENNQICCGRFQEQAGTGGRVWVMWFSSAGLTVVMGYSGFWMDSSRTLFPPAGSSVLVGLVILWLVEKLK